MDDMWTRLTHDLIARVSGPMKFRLVLQPLMASIFAIRAGLRDALERGLDSDDGPEKSLSPSRCR